MKAQLQKAGVTLCGCSHCTACKTVKPASEFYADKSKTTGLSSRCKSCDRARLRAAPSVTIERELRKLATKYPKYKRLIVETAASVAA